MKDFYWIRVKPKPTTEGTGKLSAIPSDLIPDWEIGLQWIPGDKQWWLIVGCEWEVEALEVGARLERPK